MKKTKAKVLIVCVIAFAIMLFMGSSVKAAEGNYELSYEKDGKGTCYIVLEFEKDVSPAIANQSANYEVEGKVLRIKENIRNENAGFKNINMPITMADGTLVQVSYTVPVEIELDCTTVKVPKGIYENATSGDEEILTINENGKITPLKVGTTTITAQSGEDSVTWDAEVIDSENGSQGGTETPGAQDDSKEGTEPAKPAETGNSTVADNNLEYTLAAGYKDCYIGYTVNFSNLEEKEKSSYYMWISNSKDDMLNEDGNAIENFDNMSEHAVNIYNGKTSSVDRFLARSGDIYFQIIERYVPIGENKAVYKVIYKKTKLDRPTYKLGTTNRLYFFSKKTSTFLWTPEDSPKRDMKLNIEVGKITDVNILKALKNSESGCLEKLLEYAKNSTPIYKTTIPSGESETITDKLNLTNREYYYVYTKLDNANGALYDIEDIGLYQAVVADSVGSNLFSNLDSNFAWNLPEESAPQEAEETPKKVDYSGKKKDTADNLGPQAGETLAVVFAIIAIGGVSYVVYRKYSDLKIK